LSAEAVSPSGAKEFAERHGLSAAVRPQRLKPALNKPVIAAVNRCATQKQEHSRVFQQSVKPAFFFGHERHG
jgi:hypothetical protein